MYRLIGGYMFKVPKTHCKKCDEFEPQSWNFQTDGMWQCNCPNKVKPMIITKEMMDLVNSLNNRFKDKRQTALSLK